MFRSMRRIKQQVSNEECIAILENEGRGVLSMIGDDGYPYGLPLNFYYEDGHIYIHGAKAGHKFDAIAANSKVCFTTWNSGYKKEGDWAWTLTSVVAFGKATLVEDPDLTAEKVRKIGEKYFPTSVDIEHEMKSIGRTQLIDIEIEHMTGKLIHEK